MRIVGSVGGGLDPTKLETLAEGLRDKADLNIVLGGGRKTITVPRHQVSGGWSAGFNAKVDIKTGGVMLRISPKFGIAGKKFRWTVKEINSRTRRIRSSVTAGTAAEKALPGLRSEYSKMMRIANDRDDIRNRAAGGRAHLLQNQIKAANKAYRVLGASEVSLAAITGVGELGEAIRRRGGFIGVRIRVNGQLIELDEKWQPRALPEVAGGGVIANVPAAATELRVWTSTGGKRIRAKLIRRDGDLLRIRRVDGEEFSLPLSRLSPADIRWVDANAT